MKLLWLGVMLVVAVHLVFAEGEQSAVEGKLKLPAIFGDHMVLQRNQTVPIWGSSRSSLPEMLQKCLYHLIHQFTIRRQWFCSTLWLHL